MRTALIDPQSVYERNRLTALQIQCLAYDVPLDPSEGLWWGLYDGKDLVGFASLDPATGYLSRAGVLPSHRGKGGQRSLIRARESKARALSIPVLTSDTYANPVSANNLIACGFRMYTPAHPVEGVCYWRKPLA